MQYTRLGRTGLEVSRICLGCMSFGNPNAGSHAWTLPEAESRPIIRAAWEAGRLARPWGEATGRTQTDEFGKDLYAATDAANAEINAGVAEIAKARGVKMAQVALAWVMQKQPVAAPIVGATKLGHVEDAVGALEVSLTAEEIARLEAPYLPTWTVGFR